MTGCCHVDLVDCCVMIMQTDRAYMFVLGAMASGAEGGQPQSDHGYHSNYH